MWIFITAVFMVLFFLFYRHPKEMFKAAGALVAVIGLGIVGFVLWDECTAQERAAETAQNQAAQQASAYEARRNATIHRVQPEAAEAGCPLSTCELVRWTVRVRNASSETVSEVSLGWAFFPRDQTCPSTMPSKRTERVVLHPGNTTVFNFDAYDGPSSLLDYCMMVTDVKLAE